MTATSETAARDLMKAAEGFEEALFKEWQDKARAEASKVLETANRDELRDFDARWALMTSVMDRVRTAALETMANSTGMSSSGVTAMTQNFVAALRRDCLLDMVARNSRFWLVVTDMFDMARDATKEAAQ